MRTATMHNPLPGPGEDHMITRIFIDNYRCFTNFEFVPQRLNLLLGANGAGKSSLFDLLTALGELLTGAVDVGRVFPTAGLTRWDERNMQRVELDLDVAESTYHYTLVVKHDRERERSLIHSEKLTRAGKTLFAFADGKVHLYDNDGREGASFPFRGAKSFLAQIEARPETRDLTAWLRSIGQIWTVRLNARSLSATSHEEQHTLARDGSNFASWYRHLSQENPDRLQGLWSALEPALPGFRSLALLSSGGKGRIRDLVARMSACGSEYTLDFDELSDGQRALVVLYTLLEGMDPGEGCLLLDEPELHVGLSEIQPWLVELDTRFEDRGQVFIASQNPEVVDYMSANHPVLLERPDGGPTRIRSQDIFERESGLSASAQLARGLSVEQ